MDSEHLSFCGAYAYGVHVQIFCFVDINQNSEVTWISSPKTLKKLLLFVT